MRTPPPLIVSLVIVWLSRAAAAQNSVPGESAKPPEPEQRDDATDGAGWRDRLLAARERHAQWLACFQARVRDCSPTASENPADPMERVLNDETLVPGDIVATPTGLRVFRGQVGPLYRWEDLR
jgi:hypothetical protein